MDRLSQARPWGCWPLAALLSNIVLFCFPFMLEHELKSLAFRTLSLLVGFALHITVHVVGRLAQFWLHTGSGFW